MKSEYINYINQFKQHKKTVKKAVQKWGKQKDAELDSVIRTAHDEAFSCIDCLQCANCCKTTGPLFTNRDIERIAKHLKLRQAEFVEHYLRLDEEGDYVLKQVPCAFLGPDNYCSIYSVRPKACAEYPHTDMNNQKKIAHLTLKNGSICPAVAKILVEVAK